ncbi:hypothetical protein LTR93_003077 [Exophiala xenobiotica]|nr:hypothetical protein LTR93_003077 [Exophiala xenobiotica]
MSESFYTSPSAPSLPSASTATPPPSSPITAGAPPPPPPKPISHFNSQTQSANASRTGTPVLSSTPMAAAPGLTNSPRPPPPVPTAQSALASLPQQHQAQPPHRPVPPPMLSDRWIPSQIQDKPINELHPLVNNPSLLASLASTHPSYSSSLVPLQSAIQANIQLAQQVSQLESQLRQLRDETAQLLLNHTSLQSQWRRKQSEMDDALSPWGPRQMYQRLVSSISEQEALLRAMQESFLEGSNSDDTGHGKASEKEVTDWVRRIREGATTLEKRREMRARWDEGRVGGWRSYIHPAIERKSDNISAEFAFLVDRRHRSAWASFNDDNQTAVFSFMPDGIAGVTSMAKLLVIEREQTQRLIWSAIAPPYGSTVMNGRGSD